MKFYADTRVGLGLLATLTVLLLLGFLTYRTNQALTETNGWVLHTSRVLYFLEQTQSNAYRLEQVVAKYIITGDTIFVQRFKTELKNAADNYTMVRDLTKDNPTQRVRVDTLRVLGRQKVGVLQQMIMERKNSKQAAEMLMGSRANAQLNEKMYATIAAIRADENGLLDIRLNQSRLELQRFQVAFFIMMALIILVLVAVYIIIHRSFKARMKAEEKTKLINHELEAFTYSVSHDLRAPLRSIRGFTEVLKDEYAGKIDEEGNRLLGIVMRNASQMGQLIDDLLDFSRIGRKDLTFSNINTQILVNEVIEELKTRETGRPIAFAVSDLPTVKGDLSMLKQVWINLVSNALKYTRNAPQAQIEIGGSAKEGSFVFFIRDNGVGFDMKYADKLFKVFQRLHNGTVFEGTGVGLALVHRIITRHHGKIWAEAEVNKGATFYFQLPLE